jgi:hypothetical protein
MRRFIATALPFLPTGGAVWFCALAIAVLGATRCSNADAGAPKNPIEKVTLTRVPDGGLQPQVAVDGRGTIHLVYFKGEAKQGDLYYVRSTDSGTTFSAPIRVNSQPESAVAAGTIRGAQLALGAGGRVHVAWNGSGVALPKGPLNPEQPADSPYNGLPMLYTRMNDAGTGFEPQRNLMQKTFALDGGGTVAADDSGHVYVLWHGSTVGDPKGEGSRRVWIARSEDNGATFAGEEPAFAKPTGACGCCGMRAFVDGRGDLYALFRSAQQEIHRDAYLLRSRDHGRTFEGRMLHPWQINACPMTNAAFAQSSENVLVAWETENKVYFTRIDGQTFAGVEPTPTPAAGDDSKYPSLAVNSQGEVLLAWMEGGGWGKGGQLRWQLFDGQYKAVGELGDVPGIPAASFATAFARPDGGFTILY